MRRIAVRGWLGLAAALLLAPAAGALNITGLSIVAGGTNTADNTINVGNNHQQTTSAVSTVIAPAGVADTIGSYSEFTTRYAMTVAANRDTGGSSTTTTMTSSYSITFTVDNPTGANL